MKKIYLTLALLSCLFYGRSYGENEILHTTQSISGDTITLKFGGGSATLEEDVCIPLEAENFEDIIAFQWQIEYDPNVFAFSDLITHSEFENFNLGGFEFNANLPGKIIVTFTEAIGSITIESGPLLEVCLNVISVPDIPTYLSISDNDEFLLEIVKSDNSFATAVVETSNIFIENNLDCGLLLICPMNNEYVFTPGMIIHKKDFIEQYELILQCHDYADEEVKLINMSAPGSVPGDSLIMTCENVFYNTTIGVVVTGYSTKTTDSTSNQIDTSSFLLCQSHVIFNIPDNLENCINTRRSCIDPLRCKTLSIEVTSPSTVIDYNTLIDSNGFDQCQSFFYSNYESIAAIPDEYPDGFELTCLDYQPELPVYITIEAQLSPNQFLIGEMCTALIEMKGIDAVCENDTLSEFEIPVEVIGEVKNIRVNGIDMDQRGSNLYAMNTNLLKDSGNVISINEGIGTGLQNISTLDMVMQYKILIEEEEYTAPVAIASDIDLSGSLTTVDIGILRYNILGIREDDFQSKNFILESSQMLDEINVLDFSNDFETYSFDRQEISPNKNLVFELFKYGDLTNAHSEFHKSKSVVNHENIVLGKQYVSSGEIIEIPLIINSNISDPLIATDFALNIDAFEFVKIDHDYKGNALLHNLENGVLKISYADVNNSKDFEIHLVLKSNSKGSTSDLISLHTQSVNEIVTNELVVSKPELSFSEIQKNENTLVYPNPATESLFIVSPESKIGSTVQIYNSIGKLIHTQNIDKKRLQIDLVSLNAKGLIHVVVFDKNDNSSFMIVAQ